MMTQFYKVDNMSVNKHIKLQKYTTNTPGNGKKIKYQSKHIFVSR